MYSGSVAKDAILLKRPLLSWTQQCKRSTWWVNVATVLRHKCIGVQRLFFLTAVQHKKSFQSRFVSDSLHCTCLGGLKYCKTKQSGPFLRVGGAESAQLPPTVTGSVVANCCARLVGRCRLQSGSLSRGCREEVGRPPRADGCLLAKGVDGSLGRGSALSLRP